MPPLKPETRLKRILTLRGLRKSYKPNTPLERLTYLIERNTQGRLIYELSTKPELARFCKQRRLQGIQANSSKALLIESLERADEDVSFHKFTDLPPELRLKVYELYHNNLPPAHGPSASLSTPWSPLYPSCPLGLWNTKTQRLAPPTSINTSTEMRQECGSLHYRKCQLVIEVNFCHNQPFFRLSPATEETLDAISSEVFFGEIRNILVIGPQLRRSSPGHKTAWEVNLTKKVRQTRMVSTSWKYLPQARVLMKSMGSVVEAFNGLAREIQAREEGKLMKQDVARVLEVWEELLETSE